VCPRNQQAEVGRFRQFGQFGGFCGRQHFGLQAKRLEMRGGLLSALAIDGADEFHVSLKVVEHARMLAAHWAVYHRGSCPSGDGSRRADGNGAVDDRQCRLEESDISSCLSDKVCNPVGIADMQDINVLGKARGRPNVYPERVVELGCKFEKWLAHFTKSCHNNCVALFHVYSSFSIFIAVDDERLLPGNSRPSEHDWEQTSPRHQ